MSTQRFADKVAVITGAASGIGRCVAQMLFDEGAAVVLADVDERAGEPFAAELAAHDAARAMFVRTDVSRDDEVKRLIDTAAKRFGRLDLAFNNAGVLGSPMARTAECSLDNWERVVGVNLRGVWLCLKYELRRMRKQESGVIVNCGSAAARTGSFSSLPYVVSKQGVEAMTRFAAVEYAGRGVRINAICPGYVKTAMFEGIVGSGGEVEARLLAEQPAGRFGTPEEMARAVIWLFSDDASYVTGETLVIDGGRSLV
ncbi:MAG: glucose 1-dehydrogenase [Phycisphaerae bacterium]|nr:glucose 1-dehydrogenase [Phycisphaerae bacterium]